MASVNGPTPGVVPVEAPAPPEAPAGVVAAGAAPPEAPAGAAAAGSGLGLRGAAGAAGTAPAPGAAAVPGGAPDSAVAAAAVAALAVSTGIAPERLNTCCAASQAQQRAAHSREAKHARPAYTRDAARHQKLPCVPECSFASMKNQA